MLEIVVCFCQYNQQILLLKRALNKPEEKKWTAPSGKIDPGETPSQSAIREVYEETGIMVASEDKLLEKGDFIYHYQDHSIRIHLFQYELTVEPKVKLRDNEHSDYCWVTPKEALSLPIMEGADLCLEKVYFSLDSNSS